MLRFVFVATALIVMIHGAAAAAPLSLDEMINIAVNKNPQIIMAQKQIEQAQAKLDWSYASAGMVISLSNSSQPLQNSQLNQNTPEYTNTVTANYNVFKGFQDVAAISKGKYGVQYAQQNYTLICKQIRYDVTTAWLNYFLAKNKLGLAEENSENLLKHLNVVQNKLNQQLASKLDYLRAQSDVRAADLQKIKMKKNVENCLLDCKNVLALPIDGVLDISQPDTKIFERKVDVGKFCLDSRPDIMMADMQVEMDAQDARIASSGWWPTIYAQGSYSTQDTTASTLGKQYYYSAGWGLTYNLFDCGAVRAQVRQADAAKAADQEKLLSQKRNGITEITKAANDIESANKEIEITGYSVQQMKEELRIAELSYSIGKISNVDLLDVNKRYYQSRSEHMDAIFRLLIAQAVWDKVSG